MEYDKGSLLYILLVLTIPVFIFKINEINTTTIYNYYMCDRWTKRKSQIKSWGFQIHPTTWVMNIFIYVVLLCSLSVHASSRNVEFVHNNNNNNNVCLYYLECRAFLGPHLCYLFKIRMLRTKKFVRVVN